MDELHSSHEIFQEKTFLPLLAEYDSERRHMLPFLLTRMDYTGRGMVTCMIESDLIDCDGELTISMHAMDTESVFSSMSFIESILKENQFDMLPSAPYKENQLLPPQSREVHSAIHASIIRAMEAGKVYGVSRIGRYVKNRMRPDFTGLTITLESLDRCEGADIFFLVNREQLINLWCILCTRLE